jgi:transposase
VGETMVAARRIIALTIDPEQRRALVDISRSRTEATSRVERSRIILAYLDEPSAYAVARRTGVSQQTVTRCLERAAELGVLAALDDRARTGREAVITPEARAWLVSLACAKPIAFGYPHELWTTRLLAAHARDHGPQAGHPCLSKLAQGTVCKILAAHEVKPHKVRYYLEQRDPEFEPKMAEVLCVYRDSKPPDPNAAQIRSSGWRLRTGEAEPRERLQRSCPPLTVRSITPVARWRPRRSLSRGPAEAARRPTAAIVMEILEGRVVEVIGDEPMLVVLRHVSNGQVARVQATVRSPVGTSAPSSGRFRRRCRARARRADPRGLGS